MAKNNKPAAHKNFFETFATKVTKATGSTAVFIGAFVVVLAWAISGPFFDYSETWQLVINTGTTIITFLMVFLIQKAANKDSLAIQLKLNELVASSRFASNRLVDVEDLTEEELEVLKKYYMKLSDLSEQEDSLRLSHSIDEAEENHAEKSKGSKIGKKPKKAPNQGQPQSDQAGTERKPRPKRRKPRVKKDDPASPETPVS
ncbi:MAG: low affinity iron permease family protein [Flavobacterium sp.]|nr:MAG: low affinity iron permease family protein [Flavobacterium sp.]